MVRVHFKNLDKPLTDFIKHIVEINELANHSSLGSRFSLNVERYNTCFHIMNLRQKSFRLSPRKFTRLALECVNKALLSVSNFTPREVNYNDFKIRHLKTLRDKVKQANKRF